MDISKVLDQLRKELEHLNAAIVSLERLQKKGLRLNRLPKSRPEAKHPGPAIRPKRTRRLLRGGEPKD